MREFIANDKEAEDIVVSDYYNATHQISVLNLPKLFPDDKDNLKLIMETIRIHNAISKKYEDSIIPEKVANKNVSTKKTKVVHLSPEKTEAAYLSPENIATKCCLEKRLR